MQNPSEELQKKRQSVLDVGQKNQYEAVLTEIRRNNESLTSLRRENKELRMALQQTMRGQRNVDIESHYAKEEEMLHNKMCVLKRSLNAVRGKNGELSKEIEKTREETQFVQTEGNGAVVNEGSAVAKKIRALENRLDKCLIKHNEVNAIRRTYETLLERLQLEQAGFDTQLSSTEKALQSAERELLELSSVGHQASKGRDQAKAEVSRLRAKLQEDRATQAKDVEQRKHFIQTKREALERRHNALLVKMAQLEERHARTLQAAMGTTNSGTKRRQQDADRNAQGAASWLASLTPEELEELHRQKAAYLALRDVTLSTCVGEVIGKVNERKDSHEQLKRTAAELETAVQAGRDQRKQLHDAWEAVNQRAGGAMAGPKATRHARDHHRSGKRDGSDSDDDDDDDAAVDVTAPVPTHIEALTTISPGGGPDYGLLASRVRQNRNILAEFTAHLAQREEELGEEEKHLDDLSQLVVDVEAGVRHLAEQLSVLRPDAAASLNNTTKANSSSGAAPIVTADISTLASLLQSKELGEAALMSATESVDVLRSCDNKMQAMIGEMSLEEVNAVARALNTARVVVPATNVRIPGLAKADGSGQHHTLAAPGANEDASGGFSLAEATGNAGGVSTSHRPEGGDDNRRDSGSSSGSQHGGGADDPFQATAGAHNQFDDFPESEIHDRHELKMMSLATVEREETKELRKRMAARRKEETA